MSTEPQNIKNLEPVRIGARSLTFVPHHIPGIGPRVFLVIDEPDIHEAFNIAASDARLLADRLKIAACEAEAMQRRMQRGAA